MNRLDEVTPQRSAASGTVRRATICLWAESIEEKVDFTAWMSAWKKQMTFVSHDYGCGCCIHLFDVEGPKEAIDALPPELRTVSEWTENGIKQLPRHIVASRVKPGPGC
jgi:hypothetical protein